MMRPAAPFPGIGQGAPTTAEIARSWDHAHARATGRTSPPRAAAAQTTNAAAIIASEVAQSWDGALNRAAGRTPPPRTAPERVANAAATIASLSPRTTQLFSGIGKGSSKAPAAAASAPPKTNRRSASATAPAPAWQLAKSSPAASSGRNVAIRHLATDRDGNVSRHRLECRIGDSTFKASVTTGGADHGRVTLDGATPAVGIYRHQIVAMLEADMQHSLPHLVTRNPQVAK